MPVEKKAKRVLVIFNAQVNANSMGGGDKIVLSLVKELLKKRYTVDFGGSLEGCGMAQKTNLKSKVFKFSFFETKLFGIVLSYCLRILFSPLVLLFVKERYDYVWSASDFLPDTVPALFLKLSNKDSRWLANLFLRARNPFSEKVEITPTSLMYFASQYLSIQMFKYFADRVYVLCQEDKDFLKSKGLKDEAVYILRGGVDMEEIDAVPLQDKQYDFCFVGRFHMQKGLDDLLLTFKEALLLKADLRAAVVGWGSIDFKSEILNSGLGDHVLFLGFLDGQKKIEVIKQSKILLFPSTFESFGVVVAESIACGTPVVAYELDVLKGNFNEGVVFVKKFDHATFASEAYKTLSSPLLLHSLSEDCKKHRNNLTWGRSSEVLVNSLSTI